MGNTTKQILSQLLKLTESKDATQEEIATYCEVSQPTISRFLKEGKCKSSLEEKLSEFLLKKNREVAKRKQRTLKNLKQSA